MSKYIYADRAHCLGFCAAFAWAAY